MVASIAWMVLFTIWILLMPQIGKKTLDVVNLVINNAIFKNILQGMIKKERKKDILTSSKAKIGQRLLTLGIFLFA